MRISFRFGLLALAGALAMTTLAMARTPAYGWLAIPPARVLSDGFAPPDGFRRVPSTPGSFAHWLRHLPLKHDGAPVMLFDGRQRSDQDGVAAVIDIDIGHRDLQQCADAVIRLRAEWLHASGRREALAFDFTSGDRYAFDDWRRGRTPKVEGRKVSWVTGASRQDNRDSLRRWLDLVFAYAGSLSLERELKPVTNPLAVEPGDVLIQGGSPGHAAIVLDVARDGSDRPAVLLAQSFMPAQSIHVLRNPRGGVWFPLSASAAIDTPDWQFQPAHLRRFATPN